MVNLTFVSFEISFFLGPKVNLYNVQLLFRLGQPQRDFNGQQRKLRQRRPHPHPHRASDHDQIRTGPERRNIRNGQRSGQLL